MRRGESDAVPPLPPRRLDCRVAAIDDLTHDIRRLRLAIEAGGPFLFAAGQYASLRFAGLPPRDYSMANPPGERLLEFHIRRMEAGGVSAHVAERLRLGDAVALDGPLGTAHLRDGHAGPILAIAAGSGLAPIKSIVETALRHDANRRVRLYFGARARRDLYLTEHFVALAARHAGFRFVPVLAEAAAGFRQGLVQDAAAEELPALGGAKAYLAGPPAMVEAAARLLEARGLPPGDIHADAFYSAAEMQARRRLSNPPG